MQVQSNSDFLTKSTIPNGNGKELQSEKVYEYHFDPVIAHNVGIVDGSGLLTGHVGTQNNRGFQMSTLSPLYQQWIDAGKALQFHYPIVDVGCAFGVNTLSASFRDNVPHVIGVDMTQTHLDYVQQAHKVYSQQGYGRGGVIETSIGILPHLDGFKSESVSSILCAEVIHFLNGNELPIAFQRFYDILVKGGQLQITCVGVELGKESFIIKQLINEKKKSNPNNKWPGYFEGEEILKVMKYVRRNWKDYQGEIERISTAPFLHFFTASQIAQLAEDAGFLVKSIVTTSHPGHPPTAISDYSSIQLVAIKL